MKRFYVLLAGVAVAAAVLIWFGSKPETGQSTGTSEPPVAITAADSAFPGYALGSDSAPIEVDEYADFQCPHCGEFALVQLPTIREQLINTGRVRWRFRDFPLSFKWSRLSALAAQCAGEQGKFWEMAEAMFQAQPDWGASPKNPAGRFREMARQAGVDGDRFDACVDGKRYQGRIEASRLRGQALGISGTPSFIINGRLHEFKGGPTSDAFLALADSLGKARR